MANFNTHITLAAAGSALVSTLCFKSGYVTVSEGLMMATAGTLGGILPDIDLKYSYPSKLLFSSLGVVLSLTWMFAADYPLSVLELWAIGLGVFILIRYPVWFAFHKLTVHRGSVHSLAAALMFTFLTSTASFHLFHTSAFVAWLVALSMFGGYSLHLILDELYSVDFMNTRIKRSFGSALKPVDIRHVTGSVVILVVCFLSWFYTPDATEFIQTLKERDTQQSLKALLLPDWIQIRSGR